MAASLGQEFCTLRDTYIEKQFGRLNDMQRQAVFTTDGPLHCVTTQDHGLGAKLDNSLIAQAAPALADGTPVHERDYDVGFGWRVGRDAGAIDPLLDLRVAHLARELVEQVLLRVREEGFGADALEREVVEVALQPRIEHGAAVALLEELQGKLESRYKIYKLRDALNELAGDFDCVFIDTPPALNFFTRSALIAADACLIPFDCDEFSRKALYSLLENVEEIKSDHNRDLRVEGIVVNQFQPRATLPQQLLDELIAEGLPVLPVNLMSSVKMRESHQVCTPLIHLDARHKLTQQCVELHELLNQA